MILFQLLVDIHMRIRALFLYNLVSFSRCKIDALYEFGAKVQLFFDICK